MNSMATGVKIGMGAVGVETARYAKKYFDLTNYQFEISDMDREHLNNGLPMAVLPEPPRPQLRKSHGWSHAWWIVGVSTLLLFVVAGFTIGFFGGMAGGENVPRSLVLGAMFGIFLSIPGVALSFIAAMILLSVGITVKRGRKVDYDVADQKFSSWLTRENARLALQSGSIPSAYLDAIGVDSNAFSAEA